MTPGQARALVEYVTKLQRALRLDHWDVTVSDEPPEATDDGIEAADIDGQMHVEKFGFNATMRLAPTWPQNSPEAVRHVVVHELLHLHTDPVFSDAVDTIEGLAGAQANAVAFTLLRRGYERMTDALAAAIAPHYDLPTWPD